MRHRDDQFLHKRGRVFWYFRRVPKSYAHLDTRERIRQSLGTESVYEARQLRDLLAHSDESYWTSLAAAADLGGDAGRDATKAAEHRYRAAQSRAVAAGFSYRPLNGLLADPDLTEVLVRLLEVRDRSGRDGAPRPRDAEALLGGAPKPKVKVSEALETYISDIAHNAQMYKSDGQRASWEKVKRTSIAYFIDQEGDLALEDITRDVAVRYYKWWAARVYPKKPGDPEIAANTANRHIGNIRSLYRDYYRHIGEETRENPFRNMHFNAKPKTTVPAFPNDWVREKVLAPAALKGIRAELQLATYMLIETGCRPSEIINLRAEDIHLDADVPFISIRARTTGEAKREVKADASERDVPLVGVALEAARRAPKAFEHYRDRSVLFSASLMKAFRYRGLFPAKGYKIYSFRHAFEERMQEANLDYGLRCLLMGHKNNRPQYGAGGSIAYRRDELMKIVHPFSREVFSAFDAEHPDWALAT